MEEVPMNERALRAAQDAAVAAGSTRSNPPHYPGGASVRAMNETDLAAVLRRRHDAELYRDRILGHEMMATALTDVVLAERND
jgi:hypothetical protein